jgi:hypothetical protein
MWMMHRADKSKYPELDKIKDNNTDSIPEVNTAVEIDAFIHSVTDHLKFKGYDLSGKKVVWVNNDRMYLNGSDFKMLDKETYEASPYASVYKYSHDVAPARAALGRNGCTDCHSFKSSFFFAQSLRYPFDGNGNPVTEPQYKKLGIPGFMAYAGAFRESLVKPVFNFALVALIVLALIRFLIADLARMNVISRRLQNILSWIVPAGILAAGIFGYFAGDLGSYMFPTRTFLDGNHFIISAAVLVTGIWFYLNYEFKLNESFRFTPLSIMLLLAFISGILMLLKPGFIETISHLSYTFYDLSLVGIQIMCVYYLERPFHKESLTNTTTNLQNKKQWKS